MTDVRTLRENPEPAHAFQRARGANPGLANEITGADVARRGALQAFEMLWAIQKEVSKSVSYASKEECPAILVQVKELAEQVKAAEVVANAASAEVDRLVHLLPNLVLDGAPVGGEEDFAVLRHEGSAPCDFATEGFEPQDHLIPGEGLNTIDTKHGAKVSGARFYYLRDIGARLKLALTTMAMDQALANGFVPMMTSTLVTPQIMGGAGFLNEHSDEVYYLPTDDLYLTSTSEMVLIGYHADEILDLGDGPECHMGWFTCYHREAGSADKDTRGIIHVHQFNKAEMFSYCHPEEVVEEHQRFLAWEEEMPAKVELPYRVIDATAGDLGTPAIHKFDCEAWLPIQEHYMEVISTSNCTTLRAHRLGIRERRGDGMVSIVTLSDTLTTTRWMVTFPKNHQQTGGSIYMLEALRPYLGGLRVLSLIAR